MKNFKKKRFSISKFSYLIVFLSFVLIAYQANGSRDEHDHDSHVGQGEEHESHDHGSHGSDHGNNESHADHQSHEEHRDNESHDEHGDHESHDDHSSHSVNEGDEGHHGHDDHSGPINLDARDIQGFGIKVSKANSGKINEELTVPGEIQINENEIADVGPRYPGIVKAIYKRLGDFVSTGEILATLESNETLQSFDLVAPISGKVVDFSLTLGESLDAGENAFVIANTDTIWADLRIYQKDLPKIQEGQQVEIFSGKGLPTSQGTISYIGPRINENTRTGLARVVLPNTNGIYRPGLFITGRIEIEEINAPVVVPLSAIHSVEGEDVIYVVAEEGQGFEPRDVETGHRDNMSAEISKGLQPGESYVSQGGFFLKADSQKENFGDGHAH